MNDAMKNKLISPLTNTIYAGKTLKDGAWVKSEPDAAKLWNTRAT